MTVSQAAQEVIKLAKATQQSRIKAGPDDDFPIVTSGSHTPTTVPRRAKVPRMTEEESRLRDFLESLPPSVVYMLTAVMYLGRGDFPPKQLKTQYTDTAEIYGDHRLAARQMADKVPLAEYLDQGIRKLKEAGVDPDKYIVHGAR